MAHKYDPTTLAASAAESIKLIAWHSHSQDIDLHWRSILIGKTEELDPCGCTKHLPDPSDAAIGTVCDDFWQALDLECALVGLTAEAGDAENNDGWGYIWASQYDSDDLVMSLKKRAAEIKLEWAEKEAAQSQGRG